MHQWLKFWLIQHIPICTIEEMHIVSSELWFTIQINEKYSLLKANNFIMNLPLLKIQGMDPYIYFDVSKLWHETL